jgi:hypothetical protein
VPDTVDLYLKTRTVEESTKYRARQGSYSVKTTIPQYVAECLGIEPNKNNVLEWTVAINDDEEKNPVILVRKKGVKNTP